MGSRAALGRFIVLALALAACGARAATPTAPYTAPTAAAAAAALPSPSARGGGSPGASPAARPAFVSGTIRSLTADTLTLADGQSFALTGRTSYVRQVTMAPGELAPGQYAGITARRQADNTLLASEVHVFGQAGAGGQFPLAGGALMTNATIDQVAGDTLTVTFPGGGARVQLAPDARIYRDQPAGAADARPGSAVTVVVANGAAVAVQLAGAAATP